MTAVDLDALDAARAAAKLGPWQVAANGEDVVSPTQGVVADAYANADATLIVAAVNALPALLAEVRQGRALRKAVEGLAAKYDQPAQPGPWPEGTRSLYGGGQVAYDLLAVIAASPPQTSPATSADEQEITDTGDTDR